VARGEVLVLMVAVYADGASCAHLGRIDRALHHIEIAAYLAEHFPGVLPLGNTKLVLVLLHAEQALPWDEGLEWEIFFWGSARLAGGLLLGG